MTQLVRRLRKGNTENDPTDLSLHIFIAVLTLPTFQNSYGIKYYEGNWKRTIGN
jgi:hypothetical protein